MLLNELHNAFWTGRDKYPKMLTTSYDLKINWKGNTKETSVETNNNIAFTMELEEADVHAINGMNMTQSGKSVICHICGRNHFTNRCPDMEESATKRQKILRTTPRRKSSPHKRRLTSLSVNTGGGFTDYSGLMLCQVTVEARTNNNPKIEYKHTLSQSGGHNSPTWFLLYNQSTVEVFSNRRLLKNIRSFDRELVILFTGGQTPKIVSRILPAMEHCCYTRET